MPKRVIPINAMSSGSYSRLTVFETCKQHARLKFVDKIPEPDRPLPPGKTEHANDRGTRIHNNAELYVKGLATHLTPEAARFFKPEFEKLYAMYREQRVSLEGEWGFDSEWEKAPWKEAWVRMKLDALVFLTPYEAVAIDYKTGRRMGNEIKHHEQLLLYQLATFLRYPEVQTVHTELWYLDQDELATQTFRRDQGLRFLRKFNERFTTMTNYQFTDEKTDANPNVFSCRWCLYGKRGNGVCGRGV